MSEFNDKIEILTSTEGEIPAHFEARQIVKLNPDQSPEKFIRSKYNSFSVLRDLRLTLKLQS